jgi:hypothetical protein
MLPSRKTPSSMPSSHVVLEKGDIAFNDQRVVASAGLLLPATLAERLGIRAQVDNLLAMARLCPGTRLHTLPAVRSGTYPDPINPSTRRRRMSELGANALGEVLVPGRVLDCYLGLRLVPAGGTEAAGVLIVGPAVLRDLSVPQPDGTLLYELLTGHPDRIPHELVFLADLTMELRAWPADTWSKAGVDPQAAAAAVVAGWQRGDLPGLGLGGLTAQEALALERPAMTYVRAQLGDRLQRQLARAARRP